MGFLVPVVTGIFGTVGSTVAGAAASAGIGATAANVIGGIAGAAAAGATVAGGTKVAGAVTRKVLPTPKVPQITLPKQEPARPQATVAAEQKAEEVRKKAVASSFGSNLGGTIRTSGLGLLAQPATSRKALLGQ